MWSARSVVPAWSKVTPDDVWTFPLDLIARLCAMVPPPGFHMVR
jgi:hypothetical protein